MNETETFTCEGMSVSVEETADALTYAFVPQGHGPRVSPVGFVFVLVLCPLGYLALVVYAHSKVANRPEWEDFLTGVFAGQLLAWLVTGAVQCYQILRWSYRPYGIVLQFTRTHLWHGGLRVCEFEEVRGLRLFVYTTTRPLMDSPHPETGAPPNPTPTTQACLSLVIGADGTHGLFGGFDVEPLRALAEHIHRRLAAFRFNQGIMAPLDALAVVETTEDDAYNLMHTRPAAGSSGGFSLGAMLLQNRWLSIAWCVTMLAGLYASMQVVAAAGLGAPFVLPYCLLGLVLFFLLMFQFSPEVKTRRGAP